MMDAPVSGPPAFVAAQRLAERHGLMSYAEWRNAMELRYTTMPPGYFSNPEALYASDIQRAVSRINWQRAQEDANRTSVAMVNELFGRFTR